MDALQKGTLNLIKAALTGAPCNLPEGFSIDAAADMIKKHKIVGLAYEGAVKCGIDKNVPAMQELFKVYYADIIRSQRQMQMLNKLFDAFDENQIDYLPLKGTILKSLYPQPGMRVMGDADILIRVEQYDKIKPLMLQLGFQEGKVTGHELHWHHPFLHLELHSMLMSLRNMDYNRYYGDGWSKSVTDTGSRYTYRCEDHYIFMLVHFAKHYRASGVGLRQPVDLWVYQKAFPQMDKNYLLHELSKLKLTDFYNNTQNMLATWFDGSAGDDISAYMTNYIWNSGCWGSRENYNIAEAIKDEKTVHSRTKNKLHYIFYTLFPPVKAIKNRYPILKKAPWLLPLLWPVRWISALLFRRKNIKACKDNLDLRSSKKLDAYQQKMHYVGLDFDF